MIHFKNPELSSGLTLIEVLITLVIIGLTITPLFVSQNSALRAFKSNHDKIQQLFQTSYATALFSQQLFFKQSLPSDYLTSHGFDNTSKPIHAQSNFKKLKNIVISTLSNKYYAIDYLYYQLPKDSDK